MANNAELSCQCCRRCVSRFLGEAENAAVFIEARLAWLASAAKGQRAEGVNQPV